eukprot:TRINITY_DN1304_c0_g1_i1.p1 TRINITY_DN1304_c0_g1~~TRINITY_DN1304_c0_g1_i1.p1  ORF type:complete len:554 (+),score=136.71 TRINITY_DN1304_c0_g1_i1:55-1662(+)
MEKNNLLKIDLTGHAEFASAATSQIETFLVCANLKAPFYEESKRAPIDLVTVIDRSGSMAGDKIKLVRETLEFVVKQLKTEDKLGIVLFDSSIDVLLPLTKMDAGGKDRASQLIKTIKERGSTDLSGGLLKGLDLLRTRAQADTNEVASVLVFTDGLANHGFTKTDDIVKAMINPNHKAAHGGGGYGNLPPMQQHRGNYGMLPTANVSQQQHVQQSTLPPMSQNSYGSLPQLLPVSISVPAPTPELEAAKVSESEAPKAYSGPSVHTFGFGSDHDANMLKAIADTANGVYFFVENQDMIPDAFADCLGGLLSVVGQNIDVAFEATNGVTIKKLKTKFKVTEKVAGKSYTVTVGDIQSEEEKDLLCEISLSKSDSDVDAQEIVKVKLSYFNVITSQQEEAATTISVKRSASDSDRKPNYSIDKQKNRILAADTLQEAKVLGDKSQLDAAREVINKTVQIIKSSISADDSYCKGLVTDLEEALKGLRSHQEYSSYGNQTISGYTSAHYQQRATTKTASYQTSNRANMKSAYSNLDQK